jgi:hypothetical protein
MGVADGHVPEDYWQDFVRKAGRTPSPIPYFTTNDLSRERLDELLREAYRRFYLRPRYIMQRLGTLRSPADLFWHARLARELARLAVS